MTRSEIVEIYCEPYSLLEQLSYLDSDGISLDWLFCADLCIAFISSGDVMLTPLMILQVVFYRLMSSCYPRKPWRIPMELSLSRLTPLISRTKLSKN